MLARPRPTLLLALSLPLLLARPLPAGDKELGQLLKAHDSGGLARRFAALVDEDPGAAAKEIPVAISRIYGKDADDYHATDRYRCFIRAARELSRIRSDAAKEVLAAQVMAGKEWPARAVALHAALQSTEMDGVQLALVAITDAAPAVVRAGAHALGHSKQAIVISPLVQAMEKWESEETLEKATKRGRKGVGEDERGRTWLSIRDALERLTGQSLHSAVAYRTYYDTHRGEIDPTKVDLSAERERSTGLGLFGLELTGRNIAFVLDISGSMMSSDALTPEQLEKLRRSTGVEGTDNLERRMMEDRRRIVRAKRELKGVVSGLPEDKNFNIIAYSTDVLPWQKVLVEGVKKNREAAVGFVESLEAEGITVTDWALQEALLDPRVDTVYLITDGAPTHVGLTGPGLPRDARELMQRILEETRAINHLRGVRIFTLGFEGAEEGFLEKLSEENGGRYVRIE
ncbi:MAG: vWA domain-containing protein [Planctomycetota bacterium]|jgi:hypothetical protein